MPNQHWHTSPHDALQVSRGFDLTALDTRSTPGWEGSKEEARAQMKRCAERMKVLQEKLYAHGRTGGHRSVLLVLQGMDTAGKGGIVRHVIGLVDPQGVDLRSFGPPTREELSHHFLWRINAALPRAGHIGVFDRSHYEDVLVVRVRELVPRETWSRRYEEINEFERQLASTGTEILKVALVISPERQRERLLARMDRVDKHWKLSPNDVAEREFWDDYQRAYQAVFDKTNTVTAPWYAVPADRRWFARLAVTQLLLDTLERMDLAWPEAAFDVEDLRERLLAQPY